MLSQGDMKAPAVPAFEALELSPPLVGDVRSDHAGETGAVWIYRGILAVSRSCEVREFARAHLAAERAHLAFFDDWMPHSQRSLLLPLWRVSGFLLGAVPACLGARWVYGTIDTVETFVVGHYAAQIAQLEAGTPAQRCLAAVFAAMQREEDGHRADAAERVASLPGRTLACWLRLVAWGSAAAVRLARIV
jgi:ubiquinone biosynthesis monooxygenase Coq7